MFHIKHIATDSITKIYIDLHIQFFVFVRLFDKSGLHNCSSCKIVQHFFAKFNLRENRTDILIKVSKTKMQKRLPYWMFIDPAKTKVIICMNILKSIGADN